MIHQFPLLFFSFLVVCSLGFGCHQPDPSDAGYIDADADSSDAETDEGIDDSGLSDADDADVSVLVIEAEQGDPVGTMASQTAALTDPACGDSWVEVETATDDFFWDASSPSLPPHRMEITVELPADGTYYVSIRVAAPSANGDALYVGFDADDLRRVHVPDSYPYDQSWLWLSEVESDADRLVFEGLRAGVHTFIVGHGEAGARCDKLVIANVADAPFERDCGGCEPNDNECGPDGCGGDHGDCGSGVCTAGVCVDPSSPPLAVPGALGFGRFVRGAYAGSDTPTILIVDDLSNESSGTGPGRGTLRWALEQDYPRIILFEVSGYIDLESYILVRNDYVSIYGQTAPGQGVTLTGNVVDLRANQILIQHLRFRSSMITEDEEIDSLTIYEGSNVFIDHCSFSYGDDENIGVGGSEGTFLGPVTISNCILSHPQHASTGKGILVGGTVDNVSVLRSAFVHCAIRHPHIGDDTYTAAEFVNNMIYNPYYEGTAMEQSNGAEINFIGNVLKPGPDTRDHHARRTGILTSAGLHPDTRIYVMDNLCPARDDLDEWSAIFNDTGVPSDDFAVFTPFDYGTPTMPAADVEAYVAANAGAFYWNRDDVDEDAISDMLSASGNWIDALPPDAFPSLPELHEELVLPADPHGDDNGDGYTNLEEWVQGFVP